MAGFGQNDEVVSPKVKTFGANDEVVPSGENNAKEIPASQTQATRSDSPMDRIESSPGWDKYLAQHHVTAGDISGPVMMGTPIVSPAARGVGLLRSMAPSLAGYATGMAAHEVGLPDYASIPLSIAAGALTHGVSGIASDPAVQEAAFKFSPLNKAANLGRAIVNHFRTPESSIEKPSVTGLSTRPDYSPLVRPAASGEPYQSTITPEPGPGLWSQLPVKSPQIVPVHPSTPPLFEPLEGGPGFSGTQLPGATGTGGNSQTPPPLLRNPRAPVTGIPNAREYTFSGGNQFRIPRLIDPAIAKPVPASVDALPVTNSGIVRIGQTPAERIQTLSNSPEGTLGTRAEMMRQLRLSDIHGTTDPDRAAIIRRFESPEYTPRPDRTFIDPRESEIMAPKPVTVSPGKDTPSTVRRRVNSSRAKFDENGKRNQLK